MPSRLKTLGRIAALYQLMEYAHGVALDQARAALHDVETVIEVRADAAERLEAAGYDALCAGDIAGWKLDRSQMEFLQWNAETLEAIRQARETTMQAASEIYQTSRMQLEKMQSLLNHVQSSAAREQERAEQQTSDDRYLSRRHWEAHNERQRTARKGRALAEAETRFSRSA